MGPLLIAQLALCRKPIQRSHILILPPLTLEESLPYTIRDSISRAKQSHTETKQPTGATGISKSIYHEKVKFEKQAFFK